jgi:S1-C subfamily serine protease
MRSIFLSLLALLAAGCCGCASVDYAEASAAAVRIETPQEMVCSATSVGRFSLLTARHCLTGSEGQITIDGKPSSWKLIAEDGRDHALIAVSVRQVVVAKVGPKPQRGDVVIKYGNPLGLKGLVIYGRVAGYMGDGSMLLDATSYKGDSGAAIFDRKGRIVGVVSAIGGRDAFYLAVAFPLGFSAKDWERVS